MSLQAWEEALISAGAAATSLSNTTTATSILPAACKVTLPTNFFQSVGKILKVTSIGSLSNVVTTPGTLTLDVRFGGTVVFDGGAAGMSSTAHTTLPYWWEAMMSCRTIGASAALIGQ